MEVRHITSKFIFTEQRYGFLAQGPHPYTHSCNPYVGCSFGSTTCGMFCYAQHLPNRPEGPWGGTVIVKQNAPELARRDLRPDMRIFMSAASDVYQPLEKEERVTRRILEAMVERSPNLLVVQTRGLLAERDLDLFSQMRRGVLSITVETDDVDYLKSLRGGPSPLKRLELARKAKQLGCHVQICVSPLLPHTPDFLQRLLDTGVGRFIVDTPVDGDGSKGKRTAETAWGQIPGWDDRAPALRLAEELKAAGRLVGWSVAGFNGLK